MSSTLRFDPLTYFIKKKVLLIGNADTKIETKYHNYDSIVRMNLGVTDEPIDAWIDNLLGGEHKKIGCLPNMQNIIRLNCENDGKRMYVMPSELKQYSYFWNVQDFNKMCSKYNYSRPTTGFTSIYWFINNIDCHLTITGYDFFKSVNRYTKEEPKRSRKRNSYAYPVHDIVKEERIILDWEKEGNIVIK